MVIGTETFDLTFYKRSKKARLRLAINEGYYGFSNTDVHVETPHAAQQALLDAAAVWVLDNAFGQSADISPCFASQGVQNIGTDRRADQLKQQEKQFHGTFVQSDDREKREQFVDPLFN